MNELKELLDEERPVIDEKTAWIIWDFVSYLTDHPIPMQLGRGIDIDEISSTLEKRYEEWEESYKEFLVERERLRHKCYGLDIWVETRHKAYQKSIENDLV